MTPAPIPLIDRLDAITSRYDALICDVWGVLHNGVRVSRAANAALAAARARGLAVVMLTNAPRPAADIAAFIAQLGGTDDAWDAIVSSGGVTRSIMTEQGDKPFHHIGPSRDVTVFAGLKARNVALADADYVLCTGLLNDETETAEDYRGTLEVMLASRLPLICANPDIVVERGHKLIPCAGAIADLYERMGGPVTWVGKPYPLVYDVARREVERILGRPVEKSRLLGIGDAVRTDIAGARGFGIDSLFVLDGIHSMEFGPAGRDFSAAGLHGFLAGASHGPTYATVALAG